MQGETRKRVVVVALVVSGGFLIGTGRLQAQTEKPGEPEVERPQQRTSAFQLFGARDFAVADLRLVGEFSACFSNHGSHTARSPTGRGNQCFNNFVPSPFFMPDWFDQAFYAAVPASEWNKHKATVPSLEHAVGRGYTVILPGPALQSVEAEWLPDDATLGPFHSGTQSTSDGTCLDHTETWGSGNPLMAASDCPPTWGSLGWQGSRNVDQDGYVAYLGLTGPSRFTFDPWNVPPEFQRQDKFLGNFQAFGFFSDYAEETLFGSLVFKSYGKVIPSGDPAQAPTRPGWPLGTLVKADGFTFQAPALANVWWVQLTVVNNSQKVYGVGLDYDSMYMGWAPGWLTENQGTSIYHSPAEGAVRGATHCTSRKGGIGCGAGSQQLPSGGDPFHPGDQWGSANLSGGAGFAYGAAAIVVMKSPIGDLRNKLYTRVGSPFFGAGDPAIWDDTITYNHGRMCGFHSCGRTTWNLGLPDPLRQDIDYEQRQFGMVASITRDALGDRDPLSAVSVPGHIAWDTWRWEEYPDRRQMDFNKWVPGGWDYNNDGVPDTLFLDSCTQKAFGGRGGCVTAWSDTLPGGLGNVYANRAAITGVGPFRLAAGDTTQFVFAVVHAQDSIRVEAGIAAAIDHYLSFYLGPEPPPSPGITSVAVKHGGALGLPTGEPKASVTLFLDATAEEFQDPFLQKFLNDLRTAPVGTELGNIRWLNPFLEDTLSKLIDNNVQFVHIFKSCDGGNSFTDDGDCFGDPATGGPLGQVGWLPYRTFEADATGDFPNVFRDEAVIGGRAYLYSLVAESFGAEFAVQTGEDLSFTLDPASGDTLGAVCVSGCGAKLLPVAPKLIRALSISTTEPFVTAVYVPVSQQAGAQAAVIELLSAAPDFVPFDRMGVTSVRDDLVDGDYELVFGDRVRVEEFASRAATGFSIDSTRVAVVDLPADTVRFRSTSPGGVALQGGTTSESFLGDGAVRVRTTRFDRLTAVLLGPGEAPLLATSALDGKTTTPGTFFGLPNFPGVALSIDNSVAGSFDKGVYITPKGDTIGPFVEPSVTWRPDLASGTGQGDFGFLWRDRAFGPASPFRLDFRNPDATRQRVFESINTRTAAQTATTDPVVAALLGVTARELVAARLPFEVVNVTSGEPRPVTVAVFRRAKNQILLGEGLDTLNISVPEDAWVPGDQVALLEGDPPKVLFERAVLACAPAVWLRLTCNPVLVGTRGAGPGFVESEPGQQLKIRYHLAITAATEYAFRASSLVAGRELLESPDRIRAALDSVKVVPNPFVMFSQYSTGEPRILFTHAPPIGKLRIFSLAGEFVQELRWRPEDLNGRGDLAFNLRTREGNEMAAGLYIYVLSAQDEGGREIGRKSGKFVIIR